MGLIVSRTCTEIPSGKRERPQLGERRSRPLEEFREAPAYVLVGDPGAGKTTAFEMEWEALGEEKACKIPARDFRTFDPMDHPEWRGKILFIDGLDEIRVGASDVRTSFDQVRMRLDSLGKPRFRLSCREADWLGENDRKHLESVSPDSGVKVLRLDPLKEADVASILEARSDIADDREFIEAARERGVDGLLANPQTLKMLADVVGAGGGWPESRMQTFEMACNQMVREHNEERQAALESGSPPGHAKLLDAAGRLCALQLISGGAGYTLRGEPEEEYPALDQCDYERLEVLRAALVTNLFKVVSNNCFSPVHRHIAEFLGARHLAEIIRSHLPARRVIALMAGEDDTVVTEMRGLSAWLAVHSPEARADLIERDPIGVGLYGDIEEFSLDEKRGLLESLNREGMRLGSLLSSAAVFGALVTPEIEPVLREILKDSDRSKDHQAFTNFVLRVLKEGEALPGISGILLEIVRDDTRWPRVNTSALNAFIHNCPDTQEKANELKSLLADIRASSVLDSDNELLGSLLYELYPRDLSPSEVWGFYFETRHRKSLFGMYWWFFSFGLLKKSSPDQLADLLDSLKGRFPGLRPAMETGSPLEALPVKLLARGLQIHGDLLAMDRLYNWLDLGFTEHLPDHPMGDQEDLQQIREWMEKRPKVQKAIVMEGLVRCPESDEFWIHAVRVWGRWYGASSPSDFGLWCLEQAVSMSDARPLVAEHLLKWALGAHRDHVGDAGLTLAVLQEYARKKASLRERLDQLLSPSPIDQEHLEYQEKWRKEGEKERQQLFDHVLSNKTELLENRAAPGLLYEMAELYFMGSNTIEEGLRGDRDLIGAVLQGLRGVIDREDVPDLKEILRLREQSKIHLLGLPFLAGIELAEMASEASRWDENRLRRAIAFCFDSPLDSSKPKWYQFLLAERPEIVAQVLVQFALSGFRIGMEFIDKLSELAHDPEYAKVARHASLPLLRAFPTRCKLKQIQALDPLLKAAIQHADRRSLQGLIDTKLSRKSMNDAQRVYWLAAGIVVAPGMYGDRLSDFLQGREDWIRHLATFFSSHGSVNSAADELGSPGLELVVRLVGSTVGPEQRWSDEAGFVTPAMQASRLVGDLIQRLAASPAKEASDALARLLEDESLSQWHDVLSRTQDEQRVIRRDAGYRHPDIAQICKTLNGGIPANAADLSALLMDLLQGPPECPRGPRGRAEAHAQGSVRGVPLALQIRSGNTDGWRQYWNVDSNGSPTGPRHEDVCRDALLSALRHQLPQGVDAQPEGHFANDNRADIRVSCGGFQVPVEVKRNMYRKSRHRDLWSALRNQLIAKYTTDPDTDGYGIYLVFWFGKKDTTPPPKGDPPANAKDLKERLEATLTPAEARKISVCVIDVSKPDK